MKSPILITIALIAFVFASAQVDAQSIDSTKNNYFVLSKNIEQLTPLIQTATQLAQEDGGKYGEFHVLFCGKTVTDIPGNSKFIQILKKANKQNVKVYVCGLSLNQFNIDSKQLPKNLEVTDNGILYGLQLQKKGFITLSI